MATQSITYRKATPADLRQICTLLEKENLPVSDINAGLQAFFVAEDGNEIVGNIGIESYGDVALLRSMAVNPGYRNHGIAGKLVEHLLHFASEKHISSLYLVTNTAEVYFAKKGFKRINRQQVDRKMFASAEFNGLCPASSVIMVKNV